MKHGFMLIELIVATLVASMVAGILLAALTQGSRFQMLVDDTIDISVRIGVVSNQLEKDLMGAFIPEEAKEKESFDKLRTNGEDKQASSDKSVDGKKSPDSASAKASAGEQGGAEKKEEKPIEKIFYSTNKNGKFDTLTFITDNPLTVFVGKDVGVVKPKVVRVQYSLKPEAGKKDSYALFRQESMELDLAKYKDVREYEVIGGIKNCTITYTARIEKKDDKQGDAAKAGQSKEKPKISYEYKTLNEWVSEQKKDADKDKDKAEFPRIPYSIEIKLALWDLLDKREQEFTIICQIPIDFTAPKKEESFDKLRTSGGQSQKGEEQPGGASADKSKGPQKVAQNQPGKGLDIEALTNTLENLTKMLAQR